MMNLGGGEIILIMMLLLVFIVVMGGVAGLIYFIVRMATKSSAMPAPALAPSVLLEEQRMRDSEHIKVLSIFHFIFAGMALLGIGFLCLHYFFMHTVFSDPNMWKGQKVSPPPAEFLDMFVWFYLFFGVIVLTGLVLNLLSGIFLRQRRNRLFSLIVGGLNCTQVPIGTALGVFTIIVLSRDSVRRLYAETSDT